MFDKFCHVTLAHKANVETAEPNEYNVDSEARLPGSNVSSYTY